MFRNRHVKWLMLFAVLLLPLTGCGGGGGGSASTTVTISGDLGMGNSKAEISDDGSVSYASSYENYTVTAVGTDSNIYSATVDSSGHFSIGNIPTGYAYILNSLISWKHANNSRNILLCHENNLARRIVYILCPRCRNN